MKWWTDLRARWKDMLAEYGRVALWTYLTIFALVIVGFYVAISMGVRVEGAGGNTGTLFAAWLAAKATQPIRIAATLALTPIVARILRRTPAARPPPEAPSSPA